MRIGIDARAFSHPQKGGYKTYTETLIQCLAGVDNDDELLLYLDRPVDNVGALCNGSFRVKVLPCWPPAIGPVIREQVALPYSFRADGVDLVHFPCNTAALLPGKRVVLTFHDVIEFLGYRPPSHLRFLAKSKRQAMRAYNLFVQARAVRQASLIITPSRNSMRDICALFHIPAEKVRVIPYALSDEFRPMDGPTVQAEVRKRFGLDLGFLLAVGSSDPRKNVRAVIEAYARLGADIIRQHPLVVVLAHGLLKGLLVDLVSELGLRDNVIFLESMDHRDLCLLNNAALLFVTASLYEGFGLPPVEAMACGTPVVSSNKSSLPEVVGEAGVLFDPGDTGEFVDALRRVIQRPDLRAEMSAKGLEWSKRFRQERMASDTWKVYHEIGNRE